MPKTVVCVIRLLLHHHFQLIADFTGGRHLANVHFANAMFCQSRILIDSKFGFHKKRNTTTAISRLIYVGNGTPQGTLLGPMFWVLQVDTLKLPYDMIKYADDLTLNGHPTKLLENPHSLQSAIDDIAQRCSDHNMVANAKKSATVHFTNKDARPDTSTAPPVTLNGEQIRAQYQTMLLGLTIDYNLTFIVKISIWLEKKSDR
jgi:hypothetical protein